MSVPTAEDYIKFVAQQESLRADHLLQLGTEFEAFEATQVDQPPLDPELVKEANEKLHNALTVAVQKGSTPTQVMNSVLLFMLVAKHSGLTLDQLRPLSRHICELWDDHDYAMHDAAIEAISLKLQELHRERSVNHQ